MALETINIRALRNERGWLPRSLEEAALVRQALIDGGQPVQVVNALTGWLIAKASGQPDQSAATTRSLYRKVLAGLESPLESTDIRSDSSVAHLSAA